MIQDYGFYWDWVLPAWLSDSGVRITDFYMRPVPPRKEVFSGIIIPKFGNCNSRMVIEALEQVLDLVLVRRSAIDTAVHTGTTIVRTKFSTSTRDLGTRFSRFWITWYL